MFSRCAPRAIRHCCPCSSDVRWSATQFTAFEPFRKIAFGVDSCAATIEEFTLCAGIGLAIIRRMRTRVFAPRCKSNSGDCRNRYKLTP